MTRKEALNAMLGTAGRFFAVEFIKADGSVRMMNCRIGVISHLKGEPLRDYDGTPTVTFYNHQTDCVLVWDANVKQYRSFKLARVVRVKINGEWHQVEDN